MSVLKLESFNSFTISQLNTNASYGVIATLKPVDRGDIDAPKLHNELGLHLVSNFNLRVIQALTILENVMSRTLCRYLILLNV